MNNRDIFLGKGETPKSGLGAIVGDENQTKSPIKHYAIYEDVSGEFGQKEFKWAMWYVKHKFILRKWLFGIIIALNILLWGPSLYSWINYLAVGMQSDQNLVSQLMQFPDYTILHTRYGATPLQISSSKSLQGGVNKYDLFSDVANPNARFMAAFDYYFVVDGRATQKQSAVFIAGESRPLAFFGYESAGNPGSADLILENVRWQRIDSHTIPDSMKWQAERLKFVVSDVIFVPSSSSEANASVVKFTLTNESPYGFVEPNFYIAFLQGENLTGLAPLRLTRFKSMEKRAVDIRTFADNVSASEVAIYPLINLYDTSEYIALPR